MDVKELTRLRKQAEDAVKDMAAGDLKTKAFEVFLGHLLSESGTKKVTKTKGRRPRKAARSAIRKEGGIRKVILGLIEEDYFKEGGKRIGQVVSRLNEKGYNIRGKKIGGIATTLAYLCRNTEVNLERRKLTKEEKGKANDDWMFYSG